MTAGSWRVAIRRRRPPQRGQASTSIANGTRWSWPQSSQRNRAAPSSTRHTPGTPATPARRTSGGRRHRRPRRPRAGRPPGARRRPDGARCARRLAGDTRARRTPSPGYRGSSSAPMPGDVYTRSRWGAHDRTSRPRATVLPRTRLQGKVGSAMLGEAERCRASSSSLARVRGRRRSRIAPPGMTRGGPDDPPRRCGVGTGHQ